MQPEASRHNEAPYREDPTGTMGLDEHKAYRDQTPDEAHDHMKDVVSKAIGTAAGVVEGFADTMTKNDVPQRAKEAVEKLGETTRLVGIAVKEQFHQLRADISEGGIGDSQRAELGLGDPESDPTEQDRIGESAWRTKPGGFTKPGQGT